MDILAKISVVLVVLLVSLAAYLRLANSGIGCPDWPACYGRLGETPEATETLATGSFQAPSAFEILGASTNKTMAWSTPVHRLLATALTFLVIGMTYLAFRSREHRLLCLALTGLTVFLAVLGIKSGGLQSPAVVMGNLAGGFCLLGLFGWLALGRDERSAADAGGPMGWALIATILLGLQILLGGLTSANFAATACTTLPDCHGSYLPGPALVTALDLSRTHELSPLGVVVGGAQQADIHKLHRLGAVATLVATLIAGFAALRLGTGFARLGAVIILLVVVEFSIGIAAILTELPIGLAVGHNWVAALLLLSLIRLMALSRVRTNHE